MSSSSDTRTRTRVLRGRAAVLARPAPLDGEFVDAGPLGARHLLDEVLAEARAAGYADGYRRGEAAATAAHETAQGEWRHRAERALAALAGAAAGWQARQAVALTDIEDAVVEAAFDLARAVVGRELELARHPGRDALARALALAPEGVAVAARLHPDDLAALGEATDLAPAGCELTLVPDPAVEPGGCLLDAGATRIDAQIGPALERVRAALTR